MELDLSSEKVKTLSLKINQGTKYILFNDVEIAEDIAYSMAICCYNPGDSIKFISYSSF